MEKIKMIKQAAILVVGIGVNSIISNAVNSTTPAGNNKLTKACTWVSVMVITGIVADAAIKYTESQIDAAIKFVNEIVVEVKERME
jgi:hypothetical protein